VIAIDDDVKRIAKHFGIDPALIQAVVRAEGNILKAVRCSIPSCKDREEALEITCRSAVHAMSDYVKREPTGFIKMWSERWAPIGAANDPKMLNQNWQSNVLGLWTWA
jgi:hypothetical protein